MSEMNKEIRYNYFPIDDLLILVVHNVM